MTEETCMCGESESTHGWGDPPHMFHSQGQSADYDAPAHDRLGRLDRSICGACGDAYVECSKCGVYFCDCSRGSEPCVIPPEGGHDGPQ